MLIIFDCDGVLVDSEYLAAKTFSAVLAADGVELDQASCFKNFHGKTLDMCFQWVEKNKRVTLKADFAERLEEQTQLVFEQELTRVEGIESVLHWLDRNNILYCVASNGGHRKIEHSLSVVGLLQHFPHRFSAEDVAQGKPSPALFLHAADSLEVSPSQCIVVEDSAAGLSAGQAAGMDVFFYQPASIARPMRFPGTFEHMGELIAQLADKLKQSRPRG